MQREIVIKADGTSDNTFLYPASIVPSHQGFGTITRSLSGKPFETVRGKRLDSVLVSFDSISTDAYEYLNYLWLESIVFSLKSAFPSIDESNCFIELNGFNLEPAIGDSFTGSIKITIQ